MSVGLQTRESLRHRHHLLLRRRLHPHFRQSEWRHLHPLAQQARPHGFCLEIPLVRLRSSRALAGRSACGSPGSFARRGFRSRCGPHRGHGRIRRSPPLRLRRHALGICGWENRRRPRCGERTSGLRRPGLSGHQHVRALHPHRLPECTAGKQSVTRALRRALGGKTRPQGWPADICRRHHGRYGRPGSELPRVLSILGRRRCGGRVKLPR